MSHSISTSGSLSVRLLAVAAALALGSAAGPRAMADFAYDLRFASPVGGVNPGYVDAKTLALNPLAPNTAFKLELWARVKGATGDTNHANDGLVFGNVSILSTQVGGGAIRGNNTAGITGVTLDPDFADVDMSSRGAQNNINADGVKDWGSNVEWWGYPESDRPTQLITWFVDWPTHMNTLGLPRFQGGTTLPGDSQAVDANTWEWKLATISVTVPAGSVNAASPGAVTRFLPLLANFPVESSIAGQVAVYLQDDPRIEAQFTSRNVLSNSTTAPGTPVSFILQSVPVPTPGIIGGFSVLFGGVVLSRLIRRRPGVKR